MRDRAEAPADAARRPPAAALAEDGLVLVVDDDAELTAVVRGYLEEEGLAVTCAATAAEGAASAARRRPDLILLDLMLPDQSGLDLLQSLKRDAATRDIPVVVVSVVKDTVHGLTLGAAEYLVKPVERDDIVSTVRRLLDGASAGEPSVLVVDDEPDTAALIRDTLRTEGFRAVVAHDGHQALAAVRRKRPDLVILDIMMPDMSGFEVLEALGRDPSLNGLPVVVLTARGDEADAKRGLALGARRYMSKPFDVGDLIAEVRKHVGSSAPQGRRATL